MSYNFDELKSRLKKSIQYVRQDIAPLRTGRSSVQLLDPVKVEAYGTTMAINELATVSAPEPTLLIVSPWDKSLIVDIEKAIAKAGLNLNPVVDGDLIRIVVPALTEEKRKEYVKLLQQKIEAGKVNLRNIRSDAKREIEQQKGNPGVSEDDIDLEIEQLEEEFKLAIEEIEEIARVKEQELLKI